MMRTLAVCEVSSTASSLSEIQMLDVYTCTPYDYSFSTSNSNVQIKNFSMLYGGNIKVV